MKINHMSISKILTDLCNTKDNNKHFCRYCLQCFSSERVLIEHKENCLIINCKQSVRLRSGSIKFKNHFKQLAVPFKIYADFECNVEGVKSNDENNTSFTKKYLSHFPCSFAYKVVCIDDKFNKKVVFYGGKNAIYKFIKAILKECDYCKNVIKKHFNKNLIMSAEGEKVPL